MKQQQSKLGIEEHETDLLLELFLAHSPAYVCRKLFYFANFDTMEPHSHLVVNFKVICY